MTGIAGTSGTCGQTETEKTTLYHKTMALNLDCGSETLRRLIEKKLNDASTTPGQHFQDSAVRNKILTLQNSRRLFPEQYRALTARKPNLELMDVTLLTLILMELTPNLSVNEQSKIRDLRKKRNLLAHSPMAQLGDDILFNEASQLITDLALSVADEEFSKRIQGQIMQLKKAYFVRPHTQFELLQIRGEVFIGKILEQKSSSASVQKLDVIRLGLAKWVRYLSHCLEVGCLLLDLKSAGVISDTEKRSIESHFTCEEQMSQLALLIMDTTCDNVLRFCDCVRKTNSHIADLLEDSVTDGTEIEQLIKNEEERRIKEVLEDGYLAKKDAFVSCEQVHIYVEEKIGRPASFKVINKFIQELFSVGDSLKTDSSITGICWKNIDTEETQCMDQEVDEESLTDMPADRFAKVLGARMEKVRSSIGAHFEERVLQESISSDVFAKLSIEELEELFSPALVVKFGWGIKDGLSDMQKRVLKQMNRASAENVDFLRKIDQTTEGVTYTKTTVSPSKGNLLVPVHQFVYPLPKGSKSLLFMAKEVIRFSAACINGKRNGTIHFGIQDIGHNNGNVVGLEKAKYKNGTVLDEEIVHCLRICYRGDYAMAARCIRPVQVVPVEEDKVVLEVDIVPSYCYMRKSVVLVLFPPKGNSKETCFINIDGSILPIDLKKVKSISSDSADLFTEREHLEEQPSTTSGQKANRIKEKLRKLLTGGNRFVTEAFVPVICCGDASDSIKEEDIRQEMSEMAVAFKSAFAVFDFDYSVKLRRKIENEAQHFLVKTAEDFTIKRSRHESDISGNSVMWIYTNGNEEVSNGKMSTQHWYATRLQGVKNALEQVRRMIPVGRGLLVFLVFQKTIAKDPMLEVARDCLLTTFKGESVIISANTDSIQDWRQELGGLIDPDELDECIVTGLDWKCIASTVKSLFKPCIDVAWSIPDGSGNVIELTKKNKEDLGFKHIEIIDMEAEKHFEMQEEQLMTEQECQKKQHAEEKEFYRGNEVSWWNFYYNNQVLKREAYKEHKRQISDKLTSQSSENLTEVHCIEHHPGAGGSTLGKQILWHFSQMKHSPRLAYRCCIIHEASVEAVEEVFKFQQFQAVQKRPVIALVDNPSEEHAHLLKQELNKVAYQRGCPAKLFCLLIVIKRVPVSQTSRGLVLKHNLTKREQGQFEKKFQELEKRNEDVKSLLAFNVMRNSFEKKYIEDTAKKLLSKVDFREVEMLKTMSLINKFDNDNPVPESIFDSLMLGKWSHSETKHFSLQQCIDIGRPFGLVYLTKEKEKLPVVVREMWNVNMTEEMQLLVKQTEVSTKEYSYTGVSILSQPLAETIIECLMEKLNLALEDFVVNLLTIVEEHQGEPNPMSKQFVHIICGLFTVRQMQEPVKGEREKFSDLILELEKYLPNESKEMAQSRVRRVLEKCFEVTGNAFVGQQLSRYLYIHIKDYTNAENTIQKALEKMPQQSYLLDTYGQIFRSEMETLLEAKTEEKISDSQAAKIVGLAIKAVDKFKIAQRATESEAAINHSCFHMEFKTALYVLEHFHKFECFGDEENLWNFLNNESFDVGLSSFSKVVDLEPGLLNFRNGHPFQQHLEDSLRKLQEREYMLRNSTNLVTMPSKDVLLLKPRQQFERFYGSKEHTLQSQFRYGVGLKLLMKAFETIDDKQVLQKRVHEAERRLELKDFGELEKDLLVCLGYYVILLSRQMKLCDKSLYQRLTGYSTRLWKIQQDKETGRRRYIEAYLYFALFHWLLPSRQGLGLDNLCPPETYEECLKQWKEVFWKNNDIKNVEQLRMNRSKIYYYLGSRQPGNDIVDEGCILHKWRVAQMESGRMRKEVKADNYWRLPAVENEALRLHGTVDGNGWKVKHKISYQGREFTFRIGTNDNCCHLSNRRVTFILGFSWMALTALDVLPDDKWNLGLDTKAVPKGVSSEAETTPLSEVCLTERNSEASGPQHVPSGAISDLEHIAAADMVKNKGFREEQVSEKELSDDRCEQIQEKEEGPEDGHWETKESKASRRQKKNKQRKRKN